MALNYARLLESFHKRGVADATATLKEAFAEKAIRPTDIDLGRLFTECYGWHNFLACRGRQVLATQLMEQSLTEAEGAVTTAAFLNVAGQFMFANVMEPYAQEECPFVDMIPEAPASTLDGEKIPGITNLGDVADFRNETDPYPLAGVGEDWIYTPSIRDRGVVVPVTWEAIFNDKTGQLASQAGDVGRAGKIKRSKAAIDCIVDENVTTHRYNWRGTVIASYGNNSGTHTWDNLTESNTLTDWTDIDAAEQTFNAITDPYTGEPVPYEPTHLIVTKQLEQTARRILSATEIRVATPGYATTGSPTQTNMGNPYLNKYELKTSRRLAARMATDTSWFLGDFSKYAKCMIAEKANVMQAPPNSEAEFHRRIVLQYRFNEQFAYVVVQPRAAVKSTVA